MERNYGVDIAKIISMFMVVTLHVLYHGNVLELVTNKSIEYYLFWILYVLSLCAVNCFAISTGYIMIQKKLKLRQIFALWFQVAFYSILLTLFISLFYTSEITIDNLLRAFFPVIREQYWYVSCYIGMIVFVPFLNNLINKLSLSNLTKLVIIGVFMFTILTTISRIDVFKLNNGFSPAWLMMLYIIGAWIKKSNIENRISMKLAIAGYIISVGITWLSKILIVSVTETFIGKQVSGEILFKYTSPTVLFAGFFLFLACIQIKVNNKKIKMLLRKIMVSNFSVYLIHDHLLVRNHITSNLSFFETKNSLFISIMLVIIFSITIYITCILIDQVRVWLFKKIRINNFCIKIDHYLSTKLEVWSIKIMKDIEN